MDEDKDYVEIQINIDGCGDGKTNVDATTAEGSDDLEEELQYVKSADEMFIGSEGQGDASYYGGQSNRKLN